MTDPLAASWQPLPTVSERFGQGRRLRERVPRANLGKLTTHDRDPLGILDEQNSTRVQWLVPLRNERMSASPFTFYRGTAALMAADLARDATTGVSVASCGDAHVSNFGFYASAQRRLMFDLNDFDEAAWSPWEWDLKRLVASIVIAGQSTARKNKVTREAARTAVKVYARAIAAAAALPPIDRYFAQFDVDASMNALDKESRKVLLQATNDARKKTGQRAVRRLTRTTDSGRRAFIENAPAMTHVEPELEQRVHDYLLQYDDTASVDIRLLLENYHVADASRRVVGVGSVGTRCYLLLLQDGDDQTVLLQAKEANQSVLIQYGHADEPAPIDAYIERYGQGGRVVAMQRILQAASDPFLGHLRADDGVDLYVRQFHDVKGGIEMDTLDDGPFVTYAQACAAVLARAHAQSPEAAIVAGYVGQGNALAEAVLEWSYAYADLSKQDYQAFLAANAVKAAQADAAAAHTAAPAAKPRARTAQTKTASAKPRTRTTTKKA